MFRDDYRTGIDDDCYDSLNSVLQEVVPKAPGAVPEYVSDELKYATKEFFRLSHAWRQFVDLPPLTQAMMPYEINPVADVNLKAQSIISLAIDGSPIKQMNVGPRAQYFRSSTSVTNRPSGFYCESPTKISFTDSLGDSLIKNVSVTCAMVPILKSMDIPQWVIDEHREALVAGTLYRLHNEIKKPYTDVPKAMYYGKLWRFHIAPAKTMAQKAYGGAEHDWSFPRGMM